MKRIAVSMVLVAILIALQACSSGVDLKKLEYYEMGEDREWFYARVKEKGGKHALWFQMFDHINDRLARGSYVLTGQKIGKYPAKIDADRWIWILVNNRIEIRVFADERSSKYMSTPLLTQFIKAFDLNGMEKVCGRELTAAGLKKYIPKLGD